MSVVISGYTSLDHAMRVDRAPRADHTSVVTGRVSDPWPGYGGCAPNVARAMVAAGGSAELVSWFGDDPSGARYLADLAAEGVGTTGVEVAEGSRTASSWLLYDPEGGTACVYDPGGHRYRGVTEGQRAVMAEADALVVTVGYAQAARDLIEVAPEGVTVGIGLKADASAFPPDVLTALVARAQLVAYSRGERPFLESVVDRALIDAVAERGVVVETRGLDGVAVRAGGVRREVRVRAVDVADTTGAGDLLLGTLLASLARDGFDPTPDDAERAVVGAVEVVATALEARASRTRQR